jgi:opacity protein-like surface antigen
MRFAVFTLLMTLISCITFGAENFSLQGHGLLALSVKGGATHADTDQENLVGSLSLGRPHDEQGHSVEFEAFFPVENEKLKKYDVFFDAFTQTFSDRRMRVFGLGARNTTAKRGRLSFYNSFGLGYGFMDWKVNPLNNVQNKDAQAKSLVLTGKLGLSYEICEKLALEAAFRVDKYDFETELAASGATAKLKDDGSYTFLVGLKFKF